MGVTPNNLGVQYKLNNLTSSVINLGGITSSQPSKGETIGSILGGIAGIGLGVLGTAMAAKNTSEASGTTPKNETNGNQQQATSLENQLAIEMGKKEAVESQIKQYADAIQDLGPKINETNLKQKEVNVNNLKEKLFGAQAQNKELVSQIQNCNARIDTATTNLNNAKNNVSSLAGEISALTTEKSNIDALATEEGPDQAAAKARSAEIQNQIDLKNIQKEAEEQKAKDAQAQLDLAKAEETKLKQEQGNTYTQIQLDLETYNKKNTELMELKAGLETNKKNFKIAGEQKQLLETQLSTIETSISNINNKILENKGKEIKEKQGLGKDYTEADAKDGNWWKRNMPSWLGGASKTERQAMKEAHQDKDDAIDAMKALGGSKSDLKEIQKENVAESVETFLNGKQTFDGIKDDITDAIRTGGTAAAENVYNKKLENLATEKAEAFISKQVKNKTYDSKSQTKAIYNDDKSKKQIIEMYKSNLEITDEQIKAKLNLS